MQTLSFSLKLLLGLIFLVVLYSLCLLVTLVFTVFDKEHLCYHAFPIVLFKINVNVLDLSQIGIKECWLHDKGSISGKCCRCAWPHLSSLSVVLASVVIRAHYPRTDDWQHCVSEITS